jgi:hypothetical protein
MLVSNFGESLAGPDAYGNLRLNGCQSECLRHNSARRFAPAPRIERQKQQAWPSGRWLLSVIRPNDAEQQRHPAMTLYYDCRKWSRVALAS